MKIINNNTVASQINIEKVEINSIETIEELENYIHSIKDIMVQLSEKDVKINSDQVAKELTAAEQEINQTNPNKLLVVEYLSNAKQLLTGVGGLASSLDIAIKSISNLLNAS